ncbi:MAG: hypothetical protein WEB06_17155 [Actinomycetota bacterium]
MTKRHGYIFRLNNRVWLGSKPPNLRDELNRVLEYEAKAKAISQSNLPGRTVSYPNSVVAEVYTATLANGVSVSIHRHGLIVYDFTEVSPHDKELTTPAEEARLEAERLKFMNGHALCIHSALLRIERRGHQLNRVRRDDVIRFDNGGGSGLARATLDLSPQDTEDFAWYDRPWILGTPVIEEATAVLNTALTCDESRTLDLLSLLSEAMEARQEANHALALVAGWTVCEFLLGREWKNYIAERRILPGAEWRIEVNSERKRGLTGRDFTAKVLGEVLSLEGRIPFDLYQQLEKARAARNKWLHEMKWPAPSASWEATFGAQLFLNHSLGLKLLVAR